MEPNIRYCSYRIERKGGAVPADPTELLKLSGGGADSAGLPGLELLQVRQGTDVALMTCTG
jgi:signal recognition particle subunit SRP68